MLETEVSHASVGESYLSTGVLGRGRNGRGAGTGRWNKELTPPGPSPTSSFPSFFPQETGPLWLGVSAEGWTHQLNQEHGLCAWRKSQCACQRRVNGSLGPPQEKRQFPTGVKCTEGHHPPFLDNYGRKEGLPATYKRPILKAVSATTENFKVNAPSLSMVFLIH